MTVSNYDVLQFILGCKEVNLTTKLTFALQLSQAMFYIEAFVGDNLVYAMIND